LTINGLNNLIKMLQKVTRTMFYQTERRMFSFKRYFLVEYEYVEDAYYKRSRFS